MGFTSGWFRTGLYIVLSYAKFAAVYSNPILCDRLDAVQNGSLELSRALRGATVNVGTVLFDDSFLAFDSKTGTYRGLEFDLLNEISRRSGMKWAFQLYEQPDSLAWSEVLKDMLSKYDLVTYGYWQETPERGEFCVSPRTFLDLNYRLVGRVEPPADEQLLERMFQFLQPFSIEVWLVFVALTIATGLIYLVFERHNVDNFPEGMRCESGADSVLYAFLHITGPGGYMPVSWPGKFVLASWSWCVVLFLSAYTANLATFLVSKSPEVVRFSSLEEAMSQDARICTEYGPFETWLKSEYPDYQSTSYVKGNGNGTAVMSMVDKRECDAAIVNMMAWEKAKNDRSVNTKCKLQLVGGPLNFLRGGWMTQPDYSGKCTSILRDVLEFHMLDMQSDGITDQLVADFYSSAFEVSCADASKSQNSGSSEQLGLTSMLGIIMVHAGILLTALLYCLWYKCVRVAKSLRGSSTKDVPGATANRSSQGSAGSRRGSSYFLPHAGAAGSPGLAHQVHQQTCSPDELFCSTNVVPASMQAFLVHMDRNILDRFGRVTDEVLSLKHEHEKMLAACKHNEETPQVSW